MNNAESNRNAARFRAAFAAVGGCALMAMVAFALAHPQPGGRTNLQSVGPMQTGVTTSETAATASTAAATLATSEATPSVKATPEWGQPSEP
jgi:hypothetical protein